MELQARLERYTPRDPNDDTAHFLEMFFKFLPEDGKYQLAEDVVGCTTDASLRQLASSLDTGLLRPIKANGGKTPAIPTPYSSFAVEDSIEEPNPMDFRSISRNKLQRLRNECLSRDGQMCVISKVLNEDLRPPPDSMFGPLETTHIIPFALGGFSGEEDRERLQSSTIWTILYRYFPSLRSRMNFTLENVHEVENAMMLIPSLRHEFARFDCTLEATTTIHQYRMKTYRYFATVNNVYLPANRIVTFTNNDTRYPLPSPILIEVHAAIANILDATGRGQLVEKILRDQDDDVDFLANDGSTDIGRILSYTRLILFTQPEEYAPWDMKQPLAEEQTPKGDDELKESQLAR
ncbi:hypothetical protein GX51_02542 [Blastomyces parvus]|uniref:HNH nuclease domain-containing protein n=1 Tax=Blastomyces parvus TaxID=2060905 RepID=A0A2B7X3C8_9EURO|nr:hypothetical protein GX51_02542 [Blastomyces parvus]